MDNQPSAPTPQTPNPIPVSQSPAKNSRNKMIIGALLMLIVFGVLGTLFLFLREPDGDEDKRAIKDDPLASAQRKSPAPTVVEEEQNPMGQDLPIIEDTTKDGPWNSDLLIATSSDGRTLSQSKVLVEKAGVPSIMKDSEGHLHLAFQWFPDNNTKAFGKVATIKSTDGGVTWSDPIQATFVNYPKSYSRPFDPTLVLTKEGRIRMYFTVNLTGKNDRKEIPTAYYSAISDDGTKFTFEPGRRFGIANTQLLDPAVVLFNDSYHLTAPKSPNSGAYYATSSDGLTFSTPTDITSLEGYLWTGNLAVYNNKLRFYGAAKGGKLFYSDSPDGKTWNTPIVVDANGGDPTMIQIDNSNTIFVYVGPPKNKPNAPKNN